MIKRRKMIWKRKMIWMGKIICKRKIIKKKKIIWKRKIICKRKIILKYLTRWGLKNLKTSLPLKNSEKCLILIHFESKDRSQKLNLRVILFCINFI